MAGPGRGRAEELAQDATLAGAVGQLTRAFREAGLETPGLDARRLLELVIGDGAGLTLVREPARALSVDEQRRLRDLARRRLDREPVSRIAGVRVFRGLELEIGAATLDPRPDSEVLVEAVLELVRDGLVPCDEAPKIVDLGTGSGALLIALLAALPGATGVAVDISEATLAVAARNAARHGLGERIRFRQGSWLDGVTDRFDVVISNPPYIARGDIAGLEPEVRNHDPIAALDGGSDGLDCYRAIAGGVGGVVAQGGWVVLEVGEGQLEAVAQMFEAPLGRAAGAGNRRIWRDLGGIERTVALRARS